MDGQKFAAVRGKSRECEDCESFVTSFKLTSREKHPCRDCKQRFSKFVTRDPQLSLAMDIMIRLGLITNDYQQKLEQLSEDYTPSSKAKRQKRAPEPSSSDSDSSCESEEEDTDTQSD